MTNPVIILDTRNVALATNVSNTEFTSASSNSRSTINTHFNSVNFGLAFINYVSSLLLRIINVLNNIYGFLLSLNLLASGVNAHTLWAKKGEHGHAGVHHNADALAGVENDFDKAVKKCHATLFDHDFARYQHVHNCSATATLSDGDRTVTLPYELAVIVPKDAHGSENHDLANCLWKHLDNNCNPDASDIGWVIGIAAAIIICLSFCCGVLACCCLLLGKYLPSQKTHSVSVIPNITNSGDDEENSSKPLNSDAVAHYSAELAF